MDENAHTAVVLRYRDGTTARGADIPEIDVSAQTIRLAGGEIPFGDLKAVFFPKLQANAADDDAARISIVSVEFSDGEVIRGRAHDYNPLAPGFYLIPLDDPRIGRVFVVAAAVVSIEVEKL
jgi:hypothetical protein